MRLRLSPHVSWHARGEAVFSWHRRTGDVCEMSRDVAALCHAFANGARLDEVLAQRLGGIEPQRAEGLISILRDQLVLEDPAAPEAPLARRRPYVPRFAVYERRGDDVTVFGRATSVDLAGAAALLDSFDGRRTLDELLPRASWPRLLWPLLRLCEPDVAALKLLPEGEGIPPWAESTMPWPARPLAAIVDRGVDHGVVLSDPADLAGYHARIGDAQAQFEDTETTLSHLFRAPHPALGGERFGDRLASALIARGAKSEGARVLEVGGGLGFVGEALSSRLRPSAYLVVDRSPTLARAQRARGLFSVVGDALRLPIADGTIDLFISNEMVGDLGSDETSNHGALALIDECARVLAPGGLAWVSEFGHPTRAPVKSDHLDHDEFSIRFGDLRTRARGRGLEAELFPVPKLVGLAGDAEALVTTRASFAALRNLFRAHGADLEKRAWLLDELRAEATRAGISLDDVHGVVASPIGDRTMGLVPHEFWALIAKKPL